ncbi:methyltransferase domain-containing protein [Ditylenchus destructor]|nr:methyltransferase domain-containing protein [Ditylenchus destructor]
MGAAAREIVHALRKHPKAPQVGGKIIILGVATENASYGKTFLQDLERELDGYLTPEILPPTGFLCSDQKDRKYDAAILSNVLVGQNWIENQEKIAELIVTLIKFLRDGAVVIIRENLVEHSAHMISHLTKLLDLFVTKDRSHLGRFDFYTARQVRDSIYAHSNFLDIFWTLCVKHTEVTEKNAESETTFREFLDKTQYTEDNVKSYEWIFGTDFISPGGINENRRILRKYTDIYPGQRMLDIGVGIGGGARQAAREFGLHVLGCDLSSNMIMHAFERNQRDRDHRVEYQIADALTYQHEPNTFDLVFSRDCIQHIGNIPLLLKNIYTWLKPGGEVLITMYGKGYGELSHKFLEYVYQRQYHLRNIGEIGQLATNAGFVNVHTENITSRFEEILREERHKTIDNKADFLQNFGEEMFNKLIHSWEDKIGFIKDDNHNWLLLRALKPKLE